MANLNEKHPIDKILNLLNITIDSKLKRITEDEKSKILEIIKDQELETAKGSDGTSLIIELVARGEKELALQARNQSKSITIDEVCALGEFESVFNILKTDPDQINFRSSFDGFSPLHLACGFSNSLPLVKLLIKNGANLNTYSDGNKFEALTPIIGASLGGNLEILEFLLENGADPNSKEKISFVTPLHIASNHGRVEHVKILLKYGADKSLKTNDGRTPLVNPQKKGLKEIIELLS